MSRREGLAGVEVQVTVELSRGQPAAGDLARMGEHDALEIQPEGGLMVSLMATGRVFARARLRQEGGRLLATIVHFTDDDQELDCDEWRLVKVVSAPL